MLQIFTNKREQYCTNGMQDHISKELVYIYQHETASKQKKKMNKRLQKKNPNASQNVTSVIFRNKIPVIPCI